MDPRMQRKSFGERGEGRLVHVMADDAALDGNLAIPEGAQGVVLFAHGSGSGRFSPRNRYVAEALRHEGLGTLLLDLLTADEEAVDAITGHLRFDLELLARRVLGTAQWLRQERETQGLGIGVFGASTGGGAALIAAARHPELIRAVVSRGGRPDLAGDALCRVQAPTRLIVGGDDTVVLELNRAALAELSAPTKDLQVIPGATHLFEEPGTLEQVARLAADWFKRHLKAA